MPCRDYEDDYGCGPGIQAMIELKERCDKLARIACRAIQAVEAHGDAGLLGTVMADGETKAWYRLHAAADRLEQERREKERVKAAAKQALIDSAFAKLTDEQVKALNLKRPTVKKAVKIADKVERLKPRNYPEPQNEYR